MKKLLMLASLAALALGMSSCCSMFGWMGPSNNGYTTETKQVRTCGYDTVTEEVVVPGDSKSGKDGMVQTVTKKVPRYKTVTKKSAIRCSKCARFYCPKKGCCGTTSQEIINLSSVQGPIGAPNVGLVPTMKKIVP